MRPPRATAERKAKTRQFCPLTAHLALLSGGSKRLPRLNALPYKQEVAGSSPVPPTTNERLRPAAPPWRPPANFGLKPILPSNCPLGISARTKTPRQRPQDAKKGPDDGNHVRTLLNHKESTTHTKSAVVSYNPAVQINHPARPSVAYGKCGRHRTNHAEMIRCRWAAGAIGDFKPLRTRRTPVF